ncbi:hypothetical protein AUP68_06367 [Ilyonectria robusta]
MSCLPDRQEPDEEGGNPGPDKHKDRPASEEFSAELVSCSVERKWYDDEEDENHDYGDDLGIAASLRQRLRIPIIANVSEVIHGVLLVALSRLPRLHEKETIPVIWLPLVWKDKHDCPDQKRQQQRDGAACEHWPIVVQRVYCNLPEHTLGGADPRADRARVRQALQRTGTALSGFAYGCQRLPEPSKEGSVAPGRPAQLVWPCRHGLGGRQDVSGLAQPAATPAFGPDPGRGGPGADHPGDIDGMTAGWIKMANDTILARTYVSNYYANTTTSSMARSIFVQRTLPYTTNPAAPCPIPTAERCTLGPNAAFRMTTAMLDSQEMLGINARAQDRVTVQISATCSPVNLRGLYRTTDRHLVVTFGGLAGAENNITYLYYRATPRTNVGYMLVPLIAYAGESRGWNPIPEFNWTDADVSVFFLSQNAIAYLEPVYDPFFSASQRRLSFIRGPVAVMWKFLDLITLLLGPV